MTSNTKIMPSRIDGLLALLLIVLVSISAADAAGNHSQINVRPGANHLAFDVAENGVKFAFDLNGPLLDNGFPAYGNAFVTQGYIYPKGTLDAHNGVNPDGSPEFPELVIGEWTCRGFFIGEGAATVTGPWVITTQHYDFYEESGFAPDKQSTQFNLVSDGYELVDIDVPGERAITGGTGPFQRASGQAVQILLGHNVSEGVNLRFKLRVR